MNRVRLRTVDYVIVSACIPRNPERALKNAGGMLGDEALPNSVDIAIIHSKIAWCVRLLGMNGCRFRSRHDISSSEARSCAF